MSPDRLHAEPDRHPAGRPPDEPVRILAIDVGAGTQDILIYESDRTPENCFKCVLPAQTQVVAARIRRATARQVPIFLTGQVMGGGASSEAVLGHIAAGLSVFATPEAARTLHNDLDRVRQMGLAIQDDPPPGSEPVEMADVDLYAIGDALSQFEVTLPTRYAIAVQDHGYTEGEGGREFRYEFLQSLLAGGGDLINMVFRDPPEFMIRMRAVQQSAPGAIVMDTGTAAVLGAFGDPTVARAARSGGAILVNIGNMHTFGIAIHQERILGVFEHHTGGVTPEILRHLVERMRAGELTHGEVVDWGGHGAAFAPGYAESLDWDLVAITGPNRGIAHGLGYHLAVPHGDMMLAGSFGLAEGALRLLEREGYHHGHTLTADA